MRTPNYLLLTFLILLGGTILIRTVAIAQHAYNLLLQPPIPREVSGHSHYRSDQPRPVPRLYSYGFLPTRKSEFS
jgi:hypothetical protein